jgi:hypothetical protein
LYYLAGDANTVILRYADTGMTIIYQDSNIIEAALAVDDSGNIWFLRRDSVHAPDYEIAVISSVGQMLKKYSVDLFNYENDYGSFLLNNVLYIGLGPHNTVHPNTLASFSFTQDSAIAGQMIYMQTSSPLGYADLASCSPGAPLVNYTLQVQEPADGKSPRFNIFPNPSNGDRINIEIDEGLLGKNVLVTDLTGRAISRIELSELKSSPGNLNLSSGIYFLNIITGCGEALTRKLVISK